MTDLDEYDANDRLDSLTYEIEELDDIISAYREQVSQMKKRIDELEDGSCRFHCRSVKDAFMAGYLADLQHIEQHDDDILRAAVIAYKAWRAK